MRELTWGQVRRIDQMRHFVLVGILTLAVIVVWREPSEAADEARVQDAIRKGNAYLLSHLKDATGPRKSLAAYTLLKTGTPASDPAIENAIEEALALVADYAPGKPKTGNDNGVGHIEFAYTVPCHMFLLEAADPAKYKPQLDELAMYMCENQMANGSWYYLNPPGSDSGDTSQVQFAAMGLWTAQRADVDVPPDAWHKVVQWLIRTQNADGGFCYHPTGNQPNDRDTKLSTTLSGIVCLLVARKLFHSDSEFGEDLAQLRKPKAKKFGVLERMSDAQEKQRRKGGTFGTPASAIDKTVARAMNVVNTRFRVTKESNYEHQFYTMYTMERVAALLESETLGSHDWYRETSEEILKLQTADGSWTDQSTTMASTSFALLTLNRTTEKLLGNPPGKRLGGGLLAGARGLPSDLSKLQLKDGQATERKTKGAVDELLADLEKVQDVSVEEVQQALLESVNLDDPDQLVGQVERLKRLAVDRRAEVRRTALWAIGRSGEIRLAPLLVAGLSDADVDVVREASFGLTVLSRKPTGLVDDKGRKIPVDPLDGLEEDATEEQRQQHLDGWFALAIPAWKKWYLSVRPYEERDDRLSIQKKK